jgi:hypothetical protein
MSSIFSTTNELFASIDRQAVLSRQQLDQGTRKMFAEFFTLSGIERSSSSQQITGLRVSNG